MKIYVGIDSGVSGAVGVLTESGEIVNRIEMPLQATRKGKEIDVVNLLQWLHSVGASPSTATITIEEPGGSKSARAASSMGGSFHALRAMCELSRYRWQRITPQAWQKPMLHCKTGDTKPAALTKARSLWPAETFLPSERCRVPSDGIIDALLIAEFARLARF